jgi:acetyl esterase
MAQFPKLKDGLDLPVGAILEISVPTRHRQTPVRVYRPETGGPHAAVFYFHGGAFCLSSYADDEPMARQLVHEAGCIVFSVDYGLAPEYPFPDALEEVYEVVRQVVADAAEYGVDTNRIAVGGNSAGANLAAALCILAAERKEFRIRALSAIYPPLDFTIDHAEKLTGKAAASPLRSEMMDLLIGKAYLAGNEEQSSNPLVSPLLTNDVGIFPPTLLVSAERCPFTPEHLRFAQRLSEAGVECLHKFYVGVDHGFMDMGGAEVLQRDCKSLISAQLKSVLNR